MSTNRFIVQVYAISTMMEHECKDEKTARDLARINFDIPDVYKVKVWDLQKGDIEPNVVNAPGLILELI